MQTKGQPKFNSRLIYKNICDPPLQNESYVVCRVFWFTNSTLSCVQLPFNWAITYQNRPIRFLL